MAALVKDYTVLAGSDKSAQLYRKIDDKWLFHDVARPFTRQTVVNLEVGIAAKPDHMPAWGWEILDSYDHAFSVEMKQDLLIEGCTILSK